MSADAFTPHLLGQILNFKNGKSIRPGGTGQFPVYGSNGVIGRVDESREGNGIILGRVGAYCGSVTYESGKFWASDNTIVAYPKSSSHDVRFLAYLLRHLNLNRWAGGAAQPLLTQAVLKQVEARIPPLPIQRKIAYILSAYDDLIENNLRRIEILEDMAQSLYREWFVRFRFPGHEKARFVNSPLGRTPEGWEVMCLEDLALIKGGKQLPKSEIQPEGRFPVYGGNGIQGYAAQYTHQGFVIAFGRVGAHCGSIHWTYDGAWLNNNSSSVVPCSHAELVLAHLLEFDFWNLRSGAAQPFISNSSLASIELVHPPDSVAGMFCEIARPTRLEQVALSGKNANLRRTRDLLLPRLIAGESDVSKLDIKIPEEGA